MSTSNCPDIEVAAAATLIASTGLRRGELLGLQWSDLSNDGQELHVAASVSDAGPGIGVVRKATKTSDWRDVRLTKGAQAVLKAQRKRRAIAALELANS